MHKEGSRKLRNQKRLIELKLGGADTISMQEMRRKWLKHHYFNNCLEFRLESLIGGQGCYMYVRLL